MGKYYLLVYIKHERPIRFWISQHLLPELASCAPHILPLFRVVFLGRSAMLELYLFEWEGEERKLNILQSVAKRRISIKQWQMFTLVCDHKWLLVECQQDHAYISPQHSSKPWIIHHSSTNLPTMSLQQRRRNITATQTEHETRGFLRDCSWWEEEGGGAYELMSRRGSKYAEINV